MFGSLLFPARSLPAFQLSVALEISKAANAAETETAFAVKNIRNKCLWFIITQKKKFVILFL